MMRPLFPLDSYDGQAQRFIYPLWIKDGIEGYSFSSTGTLLKYNKSFFLIFARHGLPDNKTLDDIGIFHTNGEFKSVASLGIEHYVPSSFDIIITYLKEMFEGKNFFDLSNDSELSSFENCAMKWIGFPAKKTKKGYHKTKSSPDKIKEDFISSEEGQFMWKNATFLVAPLFCTENNGDYILGDCPTKNVSFKKGGFKTNAPSMKGMSGGAFYYQHREDFDSSKDLTELFSFAGMGIEMEKSDVKGISRNKIISFLKILTNTGLLKQSPLLLENIINPRT